MAVVRAHNPHASFDEVERLTRLSVAKPTGYGGGHQTGGAVDVTLSDATGNEFAMGTQVQELTAHTPSFRRGLPYSIASRRRLLITTMHSAGFINFPGEWWQFSYGDQLWAAYQRQPFAIYGPVERSA